MSYLGRHVEHDEASKAYPADATQPIASVKWLRRSPIFDQGAVGSCTGNAAAGWLATDGAHRLGRSDLNEDVALKIYAKATHLDRVKGVYPPDDTGSSGLAAAKAMLRLGLTTGVYRHCFSLSHALSALQTGPVLVGMAWLTGCDSPSKEGIVSYTGTVRGGHEILADQVDVSRELVWFQNSWGSSWSLHGRFAMSFTDFGRVLKARGDVTVPS